MGALQREQCDLPDASATNDRARMVVHVSDLQFPAMLTVA